MNLELRRMTLTGEQQQAGQSEKLPNEYVHPIAQTARSG
jgi:hypothetical protein